MPQMSPMLWSLLFIYFIFLFMFFNILSYFNYIPTTQETTTYMQIDSPTLNKTLTWKW